MRDIYGHNGRSRSCRSHGLHTAVHKPTNLIAAALPADPVNRPMARLRYSHWNPDAQHGRRVLADIAPTIASPDRDLRARVGRRTIASMRRIRSPWTRAFLIWTVVSLVATLVVAADASAGLGDAQQACFFQTAPCPDGKHPKVVQLQFAFLGMPLIWVVGVMLGIVARAVDRRSQN